jgi:HK97 family phage major capsid protein
MTPEELAAQRAAAAAEAAQTRQTAESEAQRIRENAENEANAIRARATAVAECRALAAAHNLTADFDAWQGADRRSELSADALLAAWRGHVIGKIGSKPLGEDQRIGMSDDETQRFSVVRLVNALLSGDHRTAGFEFEACAAAEQKAQRVEARNVSGGNGYRLPAEVLSNWTMAPSNQRVLNTTDDSALVPTEHLAGSFISLLRKQSSVMRAGVTVLNGLSGNVDIPKQLTGGSAGWIATEHGDAPNTEPTFGAVSLTPHDLACYVDMTRRMMQQSSPDIEALVRADILAAMRLGLDLGVLLGSGSSGQPTGVRNQSGINKPTGWAGAVPTWQEVLAMVATIEDDEALAGNLKWIGRTALRSSLMGTPKETGFPTYLMSDTASVLAGYEYIASNQATAGELYFGNWSDVLLGFWSGLEINVDNSTLALKGGRRIIAFQTADVAIRHAESFVWNTEVAP